MSNIKELPPWALLTARWPAIFDLTNVRPLKIGIHKDLKRAGIPFFGARKAVSAYVAIDRYQKSLQVGAVRIDLEGLPAGVVTEDQAEFALTGIDPKKQNESIEHQPRKHVFPAILPTDLPITGENVVPGKLEVTIKFNALPKPLMIQAGAKFGIDADGRRISTTVKPKVWKKLADAAVQWPAWVATLTGKMGSSTGDGFELLDPAIQIFEKKEKAAVVSESQATQKGEPMEAEKMVVTQAMPREKSAKVISVVEENQTDSRPKPLTLNRAGKGVILQTKTRSKLAPS